MYLCKKYESDLNSTECLSSNKIIQTTSIKNINILFDFILCNRILGRIIAYQPGDPN